MEPGNLDEKAEKELFEALAQAEEIPRRDGSVDDFLNAFILMIPAINRFFDEILVMVDDLTVRGNRLALLKHSR